MKIKAGNIFFILPCIIFSSCYDFMVQEPPKYEITNLERGQITLYQKEA
jgi:hypothetical protein